VRTTQDGSWVPRLSRTDQPGGTAAGPDTGPPRAPAKAWPSASSACAKLVSSSSDAVAWTREFGLAAEGSGFIPTGRCASRPAGIGWLW